jgi:hypothetical protein
MKNVKRGNETIIFCSKVVELNSVKYTVKYGIWCECLLIGNGYIEVVDEDVIDELNSIISPENMSIGEFYTK